MQNGRIRLIYSWLAWLDKLSFASKHLPSPSHSGPISLWQSMGLQVFVAYILMSSHLPTTVSWSQMLVLAGFVLLTRSCHGASVVAKQYSSCERVCHASLWIHTTIEQPPSFLSLRSISDFFSLHQLCWRRLCFKACLSVRLHHVSENYQWILVSDGRFWQDAKL